MFVHLTKISSNKKTGYVPVSTSSSDTCPNSCPFKKKGCYALYGPLKNHWNKVDNNERSISWKDFLQEIKNLYPGQFWRHNQAGDLMPSIDDKEMIDMKSIKELVKANKKRNGYTYTHYLVEGRSKVAKHNRKLIKYACDEGFIINLSSNNIKHADDLFALNIAPVTTIVNSDIKKKVLTTPNHNKVLICPAAINNKINCANCRLCAKKDRKFIIGFPAHSVCKNSINKYLESTKNELYNS